MEDPKTIKIMVRGAIIALAICKLDPTVFVITAGIVGFLRLIEVALCSGKDITQ